MKVTILVDPPLVINTTVYTAAVAQWVRALVPRAEGWVLESQPRQTQVVMKVVKAPMPNAR